MACIADFGDPNKRYQRFLQIGRPAFRNLIESILLFDQIVIPTNDYMPLALLLGVFGEQDTARLLRHDLVKFARFRGNIGYVGNGGGIIAYQFAKKDSKKASGPSASSDEMIHWLLGGMPNISDHRTIQDLALRATIEFSIENSEGKFAKQVYDQVARTPDILSAFGLIELNRLPGIGPAQVRGLGSIAGSDENDDISQVLRVARACVETRAAEVASCNDIYTSDQVGELFRRALMQVAEANTFPSGYQAIKKLAGLPDVGELVLQHKPTMEHVLKLRSSASGTQFRSWFHENCRTEDVAAIAKEYTSLMQSIPLIQTSSARTIRFVAQAALGVSMLRFDPLVGLATSVTASAIDSFVLDRVFKGASPKIFLDDFAKVGPPAK